MKFLIRLKISLIRWLRIIEILPQPKRTYTYNGKQYPFYKAPLHSTIEGKLFIDDNELLNSVMFHKILRRALDSSISPRLKKIQENGK